MNLVRSKPHKSLTAYLISAVALLLGCASVTFAGDKPPPGILNQVDVAPVWSVHRNGPPELLTRDEHQYVAYYDHDRFLTLAQRELGSDEWKFHRFPVQMGWATGGHAKLSLALDRDGYIHLSCYRRAMQQAPEPPPAALYYRSKAPHSIDGFEHLYMITPEEHPHYPTYYTVGDTLFFTYRHGGSGRGDQLLNRYDDESRDWVREFETPLLDGGGERNAYVHGPGGPMPGPDGRFHLLWVWRETPDHETNHSLSYARTVGNDLHQWESAAGVSVTPPFKVDDSELVVDGTPPGGGLSNVLFRMNWDSKQRVVLSFHKFDEEGTSQIYNARLIDDAWHIVQSTRWDFVWGETYKGRGALGIGEYVRMDSVDPRGNGELTQYVWNRDDGGALIVLDEETLSPIRVEDPQPAPEWRRALTKPESDFQVEPIPELRRSGGPMQVNLIPDKDGTDVEDAEYYVRWEHAGTNRDRAVPKPWPEPTMLRVYKIGKEN
jgi:hypothetical protein